MKTKLLFILTLFISNTILFSQNVYIPDSNFKSYLVNNPNININGDNQIQISEANSYSGSLYLNNLGINDLTGIASFTNVTYLYCKHNNLTYLDVSQNINLIILECSFNNLINLNISNNTNLSHLICGNNKLKELNLNQNTQLEFLFCSFNKIENLFLTNNVNLKSFHCYNNNLKRLDIANNNNTAITAFHAINNPNLTCIQTDSGFTPPSSWLKDNNAVYNGNCNYTAIALPPQKGFPAPSPMFKKANTDISVFPNPTNKNLTVSNNYVKSIEVYDLKGKRVLKTKQKSFNISKLQKGIYTLKIKTSNNDIITKKIIKK